MANRSYLYSLSNRPISYQDRPETISGVSEWAYDVPFIFRLLMSGDPELCASLISEGLDGEPAGRVIPVHAIGAAFEPGFERVQRFVAIVKAMIAMGLATAPQRVVAPVVAPPPTSLMASIKRLVFGAPQAPAPPPVEEVFGTEHLCRWLDATIDFLQAHRNTFLLLETIELDLMLESDEDGLRARVEQELARCMQAGVALDALPADPAEAAKTLLSASEDGPGSMTAFKGLRFDDGCDGSRRSPARYPLGLSNWSNVLYFGLSNRAEFEAHQAQAGAQP